MTRYTPDDPPTLRYQTVSDKLAFLLAFTSSAPSSQLPTVPLVPPYLVC
jgi:hypothetical protein